MVLESTKCLGLVRYMTLDRQWLLIITKLVDVIDVVITKSTNK